MALLTFLSSCIVSAPSSVRHASGFHGSFHLRRKIKQEESFYVELPKKYAFASEKEKEIMLNRNFKRVNEEIDRMIAELLGKSPDFVTHF